MTVFRAFLKILNKNKGLLITYTVMLLIFGGINMTDNSSSMDFVESKPRVLVIDNDNDVISKGLVSYLDSTCEFVDIDNNEDAIKDAIFYRDVNYIVIIPKDYSKDFYNGENPALEVKTTGDYYSSYTEMLVSRYIKLLNVYKDETSSMDELVKLADDSIKSNVEVNIKSSLDTSGLSRVGRYYSFANYSILASLVYVICFMLSSFKDSKIYRRTIVSGTSLKKINRDLLCSCSLLSLVMFIVYVIFSIVLLGDIVLSAQGLICILNMFVFIICATTIALLIGNLLNNKEAISGVINVVALGSSFLCGSFVPAQWLPSEVLTLAHLLPSYYYVNSNEIAIKMEIFNFDNMLPILINYLVILGFTVVFIIITNYVTKKKSIVG